MTDMTHIEEAVMEMLIPIFPNLTRDILETSVQHPSNHDVPLTPQTLLQRCIDDLLELRTFTIKTANDLYRQPPVAIHSDDSEDSERDTSKEEISVNTNNSTTKVKHSEDVKIIGHTPAKNADVEITGHTPSKDCLIVSEKAFQNKNKNTKHKAPVVMATTSVPATGSSIQVTVGNNSVHSSGTLLNTDTCTTVSSSVKDKDNQQSKQSDDMYREIEFSSDSNSSADLPKLTFESSDEDDLPKLNSPLKNPLQPSKLSSKLDKPSSSPDFYNYRDKLQKPGYSGSALNSDKSILHGRIELGKSPTVSKVSTTNFLVSKQSGSQNGGLTATVNVNNSSAMNVNITVNVSSQSTNQHSHSSGCNRPNAQEVVNYVSGANSLISGSSSADLQQRDIKNLQKTPSNPELNKDPLKAGAETLLKRQNTPSHSPAGNKKALSASSSMPSLATPVDRQPLSGQVGAQTNSVGSVKTLSSSASMPSVVPPMGRPPLLSAHARLLGLPTNPRVLVPGYEILQRPQILNLTHAATNLQPGMPLPANNLPVSRPQFVPQAVNMHTASNVNRPLSSHPAHSMARPPMIPNTTRKPQRHQHITTSVQNHGTQVVPTRVDSLNRPQVPHTPATVTHVIPVPATTTYNQVAGIWIPPVAEEVTVVTDPVIKMDNRPIANKAQTENFPAPPIIQDEEVTPEGKARKMKDKLRKEVMVMFPDVDPVFLDQQYERFQNFEWQIIINNVCNILLEEPHYPKKQTETTVPQATKPSPTVDFYKEYSEPVTRSYINQCEMMLQAEFKWISLKDIRFIMKQYNFHYAPSHKMMADIMKTRAEEYSKVKDTMPISHPYSQAKTEVKINGVYGEKTLVITFLKCGRPPNRSELSPSPDLIQEKDFMKLKMAEEAQEKDHLLAVSVNESEYEDSGQLIECGCCYGEVAFENMVQCYEGHLFCHDCLQRYAQESVFGHGKAALMCMTDGCDAMYPISQLQKALPSNILSKYEDRVQEENINLADLADLVRCPGCDFAALMDPADKVFKCYNPSCGKESCRYCKEDWTEHFGKRCEEIEKKDEVKLRLQFEEKMSEAKIRTCHKCKAKFTKLDGCNKMTCRCGAKMCYICRKPNLDYEHFCRHVRDPSKGTACEQCTACSLWTNPEQDDERAVAEIRKEAEETRKALGYVDTKLIGAPDEPPSKKQRLMPPGHPQGHMQMVG